MIFNDETSIKNNGIRYDKITTIIPFSFPWFSYRIFLKINITIIIVNHNQLSH